MSTHFVTVTQNWEYEVAMEPTVEFTCNGDANSPCHMYPGDGCQCEEWSYPDDATACDNCGTPREPHDECWAQAWFENNSHKYIGADSDEWGDFGLPIGSREGAVELSFTGECVQWEWVQK